MKISSVSEKAMGGTRTVDAEIFGSGLRGTQAAVDHVARAGGGIVYARELMNSIMKKIKVPPNVRLERYRPKE